MPFMRCSVGGKSGWKWGNSGKCYTGSDAKAKATEQMKAIKSSQEAAAKGSGYMNKEHSAIMKRNSK